MVTNFIKMAKRGNPNWGKGKSGNKDGRPKVAVEFREMVRQIGLAKALPIAVRSLTSDDERIAFDAAKFLIEYGYGKASQNLTVEGKISLEQLIASSRPKPE